MPFDPQLQQAIAAHMQYLRDLGIYDFYRRSNPQFADEKAEDDPVAISLAPQEPVIPPIDSRKPSLEIVDSWLEHTAAAEYLEVGRSTLYRYSEHHEIESRKFCGRLQYRLSSLDEFKARHVRPARPFHSERSIIPSAPRSGKSEER